jgi:microcystin-dependent protein
MSDRFIHTFDEWMNRVNKRLFRLERRLAPPGSSGGEVPDPLTIGTINVTTLNVTGKATVPEPIDDDDATTKGYVDAGDAATLAAANTYADDAAAAAQAAATQVLTAGENVTVTGTGLAADPWIVSATGGGGGTPAAAPAGVLVPWAGTGAAPDGWLVADGSAVSRSTYANLFAAIGTTYGPGDGSSTFNLPNLTDRTTFGVGAASDVGDTGGSATHIHPLSASGQARITLVAAAPPNIFMHRVGTASFTASHTNSFTGGAIGTTSTQGTGASLAGFTDAGSSMPPYLVTQYLISTGAGTAPAPGSWQDITVAPSLRLSGATDLWQVRREGAMYAWSQALLGAQATLTLTGGTTYQVATLPPAFATSPTRRGLVAQAMVVGDVVTTAVLSIPAGSTSVTITPAATVTLTGGSTTQYVVIEPGRWVSGL